MLNIVFIFVALCVLSSYHSLEQLPKDIAPTDEIREVVNQIFSNLKLKIKQDSKLSEYSTIHMHFIGLTQLENENLKILTKLTRTDSEIGNGTTDLTTIINDILNEESKTAESNETPKDDNANEYIENFLSTLARLKETYLVNDSYSKINTDVLQHFYRNGISKDTNDFNRVNELSSSGNNSIDELEFWSPTETRRIFRGTKTKIKYFPFLASVHIFNQFTCAGSIIHADLVITAASCLQLAYNNRFFRENPAFLAVRIGSPFFNAGGERIPVIEVYFHPSYTPRTLKNNIAIMRLEKLIKFRKGKRNVRKIEIDRKNWNLPVNTKGVTIIGWGAKSPGNKISDPWSSKLSMAMLPIYPFEDCQDVYSKEYVTRKNFCAGFMSKGGGACNRDVGAPGVVRGVLTGIASFGAPYCGTIDAPTVFTKVGYYHDWIETIMEQDVPHIKIKTTMRPYFAPAKVVPVVLKDEKDFKLIPLSFDTIKNVVDSKNANRLRMDQNNNLENFLGTMFTGKDREDHKIEQSNVERQQTKPNKETTAKNEKDKESSKRYEKILTTRVDTAEDNLGTVQFVTAMGNFDPDSILSSESDIDVGLYPNEPEQNVQTGIVDADDILLEAKSKTTPVLEEFGAGIELTQNSAVNNEQHYDSERKHQINKSNDLEKYMNDHTKFNQGSTLEVQDVNESTKDVNGETKKDDSLGNSKPKSQVNELYEYSEEMSYSRNINQNTEEQLKDIEEYINKENERTQLDKEMIELVDKSDVQNKDAEAETSLNDQQLGLKHIQSERPDTMIKHVGVSDSVSKTRQHQHKKQFNKQPTLQAEVLKESIKYKDVVTELKKERQHQLEESEVNVNQKYEQDILTSNTKKVSVQFTEQPEIQIKEFDQQVEESDVSGNMNFNTQASEPERSQPTQLINSGVGFDHSQIEKRRETKVKKQVTKESKHKHDTKWQYLEKKPEKVTKESKYQVLSQETLKTKPEFNKFSENPVMKHDKSLLANYAVPFKNIQQHQATAPESFERNARPKFDTKLIHGIKKSKKLTHNIEAKANKYQVEEPKVYSRHDSVNNQFNKNQDKDIEKEEQSKNENLDKKLDEQIEQLLKSLDLKNKIRPEMIDHINNREVIKDTKLLELMEEKQNEKQEQDGETLLTFLLMTDNDRNRSETIKQNENGIETSSDYYNELTFRSNITDDSYKMSESDIYDILADAVLPEGAVVV